LITIFAMANQQFVAIEFLSAGDSKEEILRQYPSLVSEDIDACLKFAADLMGHQYSIRAIA